MVGPKTPQSEPAASGPQTPRPEAGEWLIETTHGRSLSSPDLATLHRWIIERRVTREDRISRDGRTWQRVGDLADLVPFFDIVDSAERARRADTPNPMLMSAPPPASASPVAPGSSVWVDRGALPEVVDHTETKIVPTRARQFPLLLKLALTTAVAALVAFAGIALHNYRSPARNLPEAPVANASAVNPSGPPAPPTVTMVTVEPEPDTPTVEPSPAEEGVATSPVLRKKPRGGGRGAVARQKAALLRPKSAAAAASVKGAPPPQTLAAQGYAAFNRRQFDQAIGLFKQALVGNPSNGTALFGLAEAYRETGQKAAALKCYRRYVQILPSGPDAGAARLQIRLLEGKR